MDAGPTNDFDLDPIEFAAWRRLCLARWPETGGNPICPSCGADSPYRLKPRRKFGCSDAACRHQFSVTSGTILASNKLSFRQLCDAFDAIAGGQSIHSVVGTTRRGRFKSMLVLLHKIREACAAAAMEGEDALLRACLSAPPSEEWTGYWQRARGVAPAR